MKTIIKCTVSFRNSETMDPRIKDYCWECYDRILENYENKGTNYQWEGYKLEELEEE